MHPNHKITNVTNRNIFNSPKYTQTDINLLSTQIIVHSSLVFPSSPPHPVSNSSTERFYQMRIYNSHQHFVWPLNLAQEFPE